MRSPRSGVVTGLAAAVVAFALVGCTHEPRSTLVPNGWHRVTYSTVAFAVPANWPVHHPDNSYGSACGESRGRGVYLTSPGPPVGGFGCGVTPPGYVYPSMVTVSPIRDASPIPGDRFDVNGETAVLFGQGANGWRAVGFPDLRVWFEFYGPDPKTQDAVIQSVHRAHREPA